MQYRIPVANEGFIFRVSMERNDDRKSLYDPLREGSSTSWNRICYYPS